MQADWFPTATLDTLQAAAKLRSVIRGWMADEHVLEVVTPVLSAYAPTDVHVPAIRTDQGYLHTSPEFPMKRLLAAYDVDIFQIAPVFREGEIGRTHNPEFSLLEYYRVGQDHVALMQDVQNLLQTVWMAFGHAWLPARHLDYADAVFACTGQSLETLETGTIAAHFHGKRRSFPASIESDRDAALDLLFDTFIVPGFPEDRVTLLSNYPVSQAALARIGQDSAGRLVAERFEVYIGALELGNGFHELADAVEQRRRFTRDLSVRAARQLPVVPMDEHLLAALATGLPDCAGIAIGLDRLLMALLGLEQIRDVQAFPGERA